MTIFFHFVFALLEDVIIKVHLITFSACSPQISFLFFGNSLRHTSEWLIPINWAVRIFLIFGRHVIGLQLLGMTLFGVFLDQRGVPLYSSSRVYLLHLSACSDEEPHCGRCTWIVKTRIRVCHRKQAFSNSVFFRVALGDTNFMFASGPSSSPCKSFCMLYNHSAFLLCSFCSNILLQIFCPRCFVLVHSSWTWLNLL